MRKDGTIVFFRAPGAVTLAKRQLLAIVLNASATATSKEFTGAADWRYKDAAYGAPALTETPIALDLLRQQIHRHRQDGLLAQHPW